MTSFSQARFSSTVVSVLLLNTLLAVALLAYMLIPADEDVLRQPFTHEAEIAQSVSLRTYEVTVDDVTLSSSVTFQGKKYTSNQVFVSLNFRINNVKQGRPLGSVELISTHGRHYRPNIGEPECTNMDGGGRRICSVPIEVAQADISGLKAMVAASEYLSNEFLDDRALVDLGFTAESVKDTMQKEHVVEVGE